MDHTQRKDVYRVVPIIVASLLVIGLHACDHDSGMGGAAFPASQNATPQGSGSPGGARATPTTERQAQAKVQQARSAPETTAPAAAAPSDNRSLQDAAVTARVTYALISEPDLKAHGVEVRTSGGVVTLSGVADSVSTHDKALEVARGVEGVRAVRSAITIEPERR
jgi:hyperosmotically inducible protein